MMCKTKKPSGWLIATPLFPFVVAAWVGGAARRRSGSCWSPAEDRTSSGEGGSTPRRRSRRSTRDIVDTAIAAGTFETLIKAVQAVDLVDTLKGEGPFTVFAPTDDAFDRLPEGALDDLLEDKEKLASVLSYHVVPGRVGASALAGVAAVKTVLGRNLDVDASMGVKVGSAYVIQPDVETANGVIHAIDAVLIPE